MPCSGHIARLLQYQGKVLDKQTDGRNMQHEQTCIGNNVSPGIVDVDHLHGEGPLVFRKKLSQSKGCHLHHHTKAYCELYSVVQCDSTVCYVVVRCGTLWYGVIRYGTVWYGTVRYGTMCLTVWLRRAWHSALHTESKLQPA